MKRLFQRNLAAMALLALAPPVFAQGWGTVDVKSGFGDEVKVHHGLFGTRDTEVKDRLGDGYINKKGYFGTRDQGVSVLGNSYQQHRGLVGGTQVEARTIFGDRVESKKTFFGLGPRKTTVDFSGVGSIVQQFTSGRMFNARMPVSGMVPMGNDMPQSGQSAPAANQLDAHNGLGMPADQGEARQPGPPMEEMPRPYGP